MAVLTAVGTSRGSARQPTYFSCVAKRSRQEKATLRWRSATRTAHAASTEIGKRPKLAALRQRTLLFPISALATCRHLTGFTATATATATATVATRNVKGTRNCRCAELTATATVAARNVKGNRNCRCAELTATA